jgi:CxxC motif-containing protein (DUF1111 family)
MQRRLGITIALGLTTASLAFLHTGASPADLRQLLLSLPVTSQLGGDTTRPLVVPNAFSFPAANTPPEHIRAFSFGNRLFNTNWVEAPASVKAFDGLGPLFNRVSCSSCHTKDGRGTPPDDGKGPFDSMLLRISIPGVGAQGGPKSVPGFGDQLSERGIKDVVPEGVAVIAYSGVNGVFGDGTNFTLRKPAYTIGETGYGPLPNETLISPRVAPHMIGLGLLEAVPDDTLLALEDLGDVDGDGISGRANRVWNTKTKSLSIGRFGWKAGQPDLLNQNAAAAIGDMGLTTTIHPNENCTTVQSACSTVLNGGLPEISDDFLEKLTLYTATLSVPAQRGADAPMVKRGAVIFRDMKCSACHIPTLKSGPHPVAEVAIQTFHPFTDLLLHDMGQGLADNRPEFDADGHEWRTAPLWGLGLVQTVNGHLNLLHDGRARGFAEAILWHGGEAEAAREAFRIAPQTDRDALVAFLKSL